MKTKYFICSDIHSFYKEWMAALELQGFDINNPNHIVVVLGDLFDRGLEATNCLDFARDMVKRKRFLYVRGNHEDLLQDCYDAAVCDRHVPYHYFSNGTVDTVSRLTGLSRIDIQLGFFDDDYLNLKLSPVLLFIDENACNYIELGDYVLVHGWLPQTPDGSIDPNWRRRGDRWDSARWTNGIEQHKLGHTLPNKTIICGHWHCSYGHYLAHPEWDELPPKSDPHFQESFSPYAADGLIAIDACTAYSGFVNCVCLEI